MPPLDQIVRAMTRDTTGLDVRDRKHYFTNYPRCVVGREVVDWMISTVSALQGQRDMAVELGQQLAAHGTFKHVKNEQNFEDAYLFYSFDPQVSRAPLPTSFCMP